MSSPPQDDSKPPATQYYYAIRKCDSLEAPAIFMSLEDCNLFLDQHENDVTVESKRCLTMQEAVEYVLAKPANINEESDDEGGSKKRSADPEPISPLAAAKRPRTSPASTHYPQLPLAQKSFHAAALQEYSPFVAGRVLPQPQSQASIVPLAQSHAPDSAQTRVPSVRELLAHAQKRTSPEAVEAVEVAPAKDEQWKRYEDRINLLAEYREEYGTCNIPKGHVSVKGKTNKFRHLDIYVDDFRKQTKNFEHNPVLSLLTEDQVDRLLAMGFCVNPVRDQGKIVRKQEQRFEDNIKRLAEYKEQYGTCDIPTNHSTVKGSEKFENLDRWILEMRKQIKFFQEDPSYSFLNQDKVEQLMKLGFVMKPTRGKIEKRIADFQATWDEMLPKLKDYHEANGHSNVPIFPRTDFGNWVIRVREEFNRMKQGEESALTAEYMAELSKLGFVLSVRRRQKDKDRAYQWLEFRTTHGREPRREVEGEETIAAWASKIRRKYRCLQEGKKTNLTQEHVKLLQKWGFNFVVDSKFVPSVPRSAAKESKTWQERFEELLAYKKEHGDFLVPQSHPTLGQWVKRMRKEYQRLQSGVLMGRVRAANLEKLAKIGFVFEVRKATAKRGPRVLAAELKNMAAAARDDDEEDEEDDDDGAGDGPKQLYYGYPQPSPHRSFAGMGFI